MIFNNWPYKFNIFFIIGNAPLQQPQCREYVIRCAMHTRIQGQSTSKEHIVDENVDINEVIRKFVANYNRKRQKKMMMYNIIT